MKATNVTRLAAVIVMIFTASAGNNITIKTITAEDVYDSFIYQDFVVEGTVESIVREEVHPQDLTPGLGGKRKIPMARVKFKVSKVLIGDLDKSEITVVGMIGLRQDYAFDLEIGDKYLLALVFWNRGKYHEGGAYILRRDDTRFLIKGERWFRGRKGDHISSGRLPDLYTVVEEIKYMRSIKTLTREAELIVRGDVVDVWEAVNKMEDGTNKRIVHVKLNIKTKFKGDIDGDVVTIKMIRKCCYIPFWKKRVPEMHKGEDWIVFLKWAEEPGYYPFAGVNGMFRIEDNNLIRYNIDSLILKQTPESLEREIAQETSRGGDRDER